MVNKRLFWASIFGNALDHYDVALYGLLAPILAPLFFPHSDATLSLLYTYILMSASLITKPLGALFFGKFSLLRGPKQALMLSLCGIGFSTAALGALPTFAHVGILAPILLSLCRLIQGFFAAGEQSIGNLYLIELTDERHRGTINSAFNSACVVGIFMASIGVTLVVNSTAPNIYWRLPFLFGSITALIGLYVRSHLPETTFKPKSKIKLPIKQLIAPLVRTLLGSSLTYLTYTIPFVFFNHFIPLITTIPLAQMLQYNSLFLLLDFLLLPLFGALSDRFNPLYWMTTAALLLAATAIPLFLLLPQASLFTVLAIRLWIVLLGLAFLAPLQAWFFSLFSREDCYLLSGFGYTMGELLLGKTTPTICLFLWRTFHSTAAPASYIALIALLAAVAVLTSQRQKTPLTDIPKCST